MKRALLLALAVALPVQAGIVIQKNGNVFVGTIDAEDVKEKSVTVRHPRTEETSPAAPGVMTFDMKDVRWFDAKADFPTDAYFDKFLREPLDPHWAKYERDYIDRHTQVPVDTRPPVDLYPLAAIATPHRARGCELSIRKPAGWSAREENGILMLSSEDGRNTRIHIFASDLAGEHALSVSREALRKIGTQFESETRERGALEWVTIFARGKRNVRALRRIIQTETATAFAVAYADEHDWEKVLPLVKKSLATFEAHDR